MKRLLAGALVVLLGSAAGCSENPVPESRAQADTRTQNAQVAIQELKDKDPSSQRFLDNSYAYVVFPNVSQGGLVVGGAGGDGVVFRNGHVIGYATMSQASVGAQIGGATFHEIIFFKDANAFNQFKAGKTAFDARATAVAASAGAGNATDYQNGVVVYALPQSGLMAQAAVGGQSFKYQPASALASE